MEIFTPGWYNDEKSKEAFMKNKATVAVVTLGHYVYFEQFEGLEERLREKTGEFILSLIFERNFEILPDRCYITLKQHQIKTAPGRNDESRQKQDN